MLEGKKTILGLAVILIPYLDQVQQQVLDSPQLLSPDWTLGLQGFGLILALYGRIVAKGPLGESNAPH